MPLNMLLLLVFFKLF